MVRAIGLLWATLLAVAVATPVTSQELSAEPAATSLSLLHDIVEPAAVPWWPPAAGWYVIGGSILALLVGWLIARRRRIIANRYREAALSELQLMRKDPAAVRGLSALLKRVALVAWPRSRVAQQSGGSWWQFIDSDGGESFAEQHGTTLDKLSYGSREEMLPDEEVGLAAVAVEDWIRHHHGGRKR